MDQRSLEQRIFDITEEKFEQLALDVFQFQFGQNEFYRKFCTAFGRAPHLVKKMADIPFLPVEFFKTKKIYSSSALPELTFTSSGTTGQITSTHFVAKKSLYQNSFLSAFGMFYGDPQDMIIFALLPSYLEREGSSLVYMADRLIRESGDAASGFYLHNYKELSEKIRSVENSGKQILLLGVTYALLDLAELFPQPLKNVIVMETGGMKGKRKEMVREEIHEILKNAFGVETIHSEYGMTELLSQAYSKGNGIFYCPPWMRIIVREMNDPLTETSIGKTGGVNIIDLANLYSCSFLSTSDLGRKNADQSFEVLGRFDNSDLRGCNLMVE